MTTLGSSLNTTFRPNTAKGQNAAYYTNGHDPMKVWRPPATALADAGIVGPTTAPTTGTSAASASVSTGIHLVRYRYRDSRSLYVSNPSPYASVTVSTAGHKITITPAASSDSKVDQIVIEISPVGSVEYYVAGVYDNTATARDFTDADTTLIQQQLVSANWGAYGHEPPDYWSTMAIHSGRMFGGGRHDFTLTVTMTNSSTAVTGSGFSLGWGDWKLKEGSDVYDIASVTDASNLVLGSNYSGTTGSKSVTIYNAQPNRLFWTKSLYLESWKLTEWQRDVLQNSGDRLIGLKSYIGDLFIFGRFSIERLVYQTDPANGTLIQIPGNRGLANQRCLIEFEGILYGMDRMGMWAMNGSTPKHLSDAVDEYLRDEIDWDYDNKFHAVYEPVDRLLLFFYVATGDTEPKYAAVMEIDTGKWWIENWDQGITASAVVPMGGSIRCLLGDENGYSWAYGDGSGFDGVAPGYDAVLTATGTPTTTVISVAETLQTSPSLAGVMCYHVDSGESRVISGNTSSQITVASAFSAAPSADDVLYIGRVPFELLTKWNPLGKMQTRLQDMRYEKRGVVFRLALVPGSATGKLYVEFFFDFSDTAYQFTNAIPAGILDDGVSCAGSTSKITVDLDNGSGDGYSFIPVPNEPFRVVRAKITSDRPDGDLRILGYDFYAMIEEGDNN